MICNGEKRVPQCDAASLQNCFSPPRHPLTIQACQSRCTKTAVFRGFNTNRLLLSGKNGRGPALLGAENTNGFSLTGISVTDATWITTQPCESMNPELREQHIQTKTVFVAGMPLPMTIPPSSPQTTSHNLVTAPLSICSISACK